MSAPAISVVVPVGPGVGPYLTEALDSLAAQRDAPPFEVLLVLDRPDPGTVEHLARYPTFHRLQGGPGLIAALTVGVRAARAPLLARFDADDVAHPERLAAQQAAFEADPGLALLGARVEPIGDTGDGYRRFIAWQNAQRTPAALALARFAECPIAHPTFMLPTERLRRLGGYRDCGWPEDLDLLCRIVAAGGRLAKLPAVLHGWRDRPERHSRRDARYAPAAFDRCRAHHLAAALPGLLDGRPLMVWGAGKGGGRLGRALTAAGVGVAAYVDIDPRKIGSTRHGRPVLDGRDAAAAALHAERPVLLAAVGGHGGAVLQAALRARGLVEGRDWLATAAPWTALDATSSAAPADAS